MPARSVGTVEPLDEARAEMARSLAQWRRAWAVACKARKRGVEMGASRLASERGVEMGHRGLASVASRLSQCVPGRREGGPGGR